MFQNAKILTVAAANSGAYRRRANISVGRSVHVAERDDWHRDQRDAA